MRRKSQNTDLHAVALWVAADGKDAHACHFTKLAVNGGDRPFQAAALLSHPEVSHVRLHLSDRVHPQERASAQCQCMTLNQVRVQGQRMRGSTLGTGVAREGSAVPHLARRPQH